MTRIYTFLSSVYYYFYERSRAVILSSRSGSKGLSALESILTGLIAGKAVHVCSISNSPSSSASTGLATTVISNPIWVVQTSQAVRTMGGSSDSSQTAVIKKLGFIETSRKLLAKDGIGAFWRGIGPALILVINPVLQYTVFEQLKNLLISRRKSRLKAAGLATAVVLLSDLDFFLLGAFSKLGRSIHVFTCSVRLIPSRLVATAATYPYM